MYTYDQIRTVHLEITQKCQAACPMCDRNENGGVDNRHITNAELSLHDCQSIFTPAFIQQLNTCLLYTSPSPRDKRQSRMPSSA